MRGGEINDSICLVVNYSVGKCRSRGGLGNYKRRDSVRRQDFRRHRAESLTEKPRIASHNHACAQRLLRSDVAGDPAHGALHIGKGELFGHDRPPTRRAKLDLR